MHFGIFMEFGLRDGGSEAEAFREGLDLVDAAEAWGLDSAWLSEFHFSPDRSVLSSPIVVAAALAARTQRMRIGIAVYVLPLNNPLRIAEEAATVDQISGGRLDFGIGRSGFVRSYNSYNIDYGESQGRFEEALQILRKAWSGKKFSFDGTFYKVTDALVVPQPVQKPYPPMRMAATSAATFKTVAEQGLPLFVGLRGDGLATLVENIKMYRETWHRSGHEGDGSVYLRVPVYAASTETAAFEEPRDNIIYYFERQARLIAASSPKGGNAERSNTAATLSALSYEDILRDRVAFGTAAQLIDRVNEWRDVLGIDGITAEMNAGGMLSEAQVKNSLRIIASDVMPAFK
ncbi:MAG: LLM class flavin-dependent oxidoreductase [Rhodospirillaceae bacterium]|jgi:alkanesulfonate monooxygenase SsuD/methylene tetrahydromethanopterin reductase-like flavin-dependent oxidoreductase (luciferase family)|nr:LLM class flavin-dependent oxidoreductase [Rhodospirillaceae bacterium]MBT5526911.1 LLM class flavin-dependent oxidoreductase [Rhodospirillaceae bacterium]MBT5878441.1 LLM class flavin-dependent oxidoreductase [Rhodospirillaceae bacterium]MBT6913095.1 LLM class flavin-dependent oxidoreductase [Rhodospirillaceae bacterium]MBT7286742.1 LLM class flavin-dependent oxidoreductase [Rhodospirillaceae bacterium]